MDIIVTFTTNRQREENQSLLVKAVRSASTYKVIISGAEARRWQRNLAGAGIDSEVIGTLPREGEAGISLAIRVQKLARDPASSGKTIWIIGRPRGLQAISDDLRSDGMDARWLPTFTQELVPEESLEFLEARKRLRILVGKAIRRLGRKTGTMHDVSALVFAEWPELEAKDYRDRVFGFRRFRAICEVCGIPVSGTVVSLPTPLNEPGPTPGA